MGEVVGGAPPWMPSMTDMRNAHLAQVEALETIVSAIGAKQQSSISELNRQVEAIMEWQTEITARDRLRLVDKVENAVQDVSYAEPVIVTDAAGEEMLTERSVLTELSEEDVSIPAKIPEKDIIHQPPLEEHIEKGANWF